MITPNCWKTTITDPRHVFAVYVPAALCGRFVLGDWKAWGSVIRPQDALHVSVAGAASIPEVRSLAWADAGSPAVLDRQIPWSRVRCMPGHRRVFGHAVHPQSDASRSNAEDGNVIVLAGMPTSV